MVLGAAGLGGVWGKVDPEESIETILYALENGIERIDTAPAYSRSEEFLGKALRKWRGRQPFVSTKVGRLKGATAEECNTNYDIKVMGESVEQSMEMLGRTKLDLLFLHEPEKVPIAQIPEVIDFLVHLKKQGIVLQIGFGGSPTPPYFEYMERGLFDVSMGYNNLDAACLDGMRTDIPFLTQQGVLIYQGSPLHMGLLGNSYTLLASQRPDWLPQRVIENAQMANSLAEQSDMSLTSLAHRFMMSIYEIDFMVIGAKNMLELKSTLKDYETGQLDEKLFNRIIEQIK